MVLGNQLYAWAGGLDKMTSEDPSRSRYGATSLGRQREVRWHLLTPHSMAQDHDAALITASAQPCMPGFQLPWGSKSMSPPKPTTRKSHPIYWGLLWPEIPQDPPRPCSSPSLVARDTQLTPNSAGTWPTIRPSRPNPCPPPPASLPILLQQLLSERHVHLSLLNRWRLLPTLTILWFCDPAFLYVSDLCQADTVFINMGDNVVN